MVTLPYKKIPYLKCGNLLQYLELLFKIMVSSLSTVFSGISFERLCTTSLISVRDRDPSLLNIHEFPATKYCELSSRLWESCLSTSVWTPLGNYSFSSFKVEYVPNTYTFCFFISCTFQNYSGNSKSTKKPLTLKSNTKKWHSLQKFSFQLILHPGHYWCHWEKKNQTKACFR